ncbi:MAG: hypothetical protein QM703_13035 [Gemmatales bacterium]
MLRFILVVSFVLLALLSSNEPKILAQEPLKERVKPCMEWGVEFLKQSQTNAGTWSFHGDASPTHDKVVGMTALCSLALLKSGVPVRNLQIQAAARVIRDKAIDPTYSSTYSVSLSTIFLLQLSNFYLFGIRSEDTRLLVILVEKILAGQTPDGPLGIQTSERRNSRQLQHPVCDDGLMGSPFLRSFGFVPPHRESHG